MVDPRQIAARLLGVVEWQTDVSGFCRCPGEAAHTSPTGPKDCRVNVDGAPTIFCFHASCAPAVAEANRRLRREIGASPWEMTLPSGRVLRSGDVLQTSGEVLHREVIQAQARAAGQTADDRLVLETIRAMAARFKPELFDVFRWPVADILRESPMASSPPVAPPRGSLRAGRRSFGSIK